MTINMTCAEYLSTLSKPELCCWVKLNLSRKQIAKMWLALKPRPMDKEMPNYSLGHYIIYLCNHSDIGKEIEKEIGDKYSLLPNTNQLSQNIVDLINKAKLGNLKTLDLSCLLIERLPNSLFDLTHLEELFLGGNSLDTLPNNMSFFKLLRTLDLHQNKISFIPSNISSLSNLQTLYLNFNQLTSLPNELGNLSNLRILLLSFNQLTSLPNELGNLSNLQYLLLNSNQLTSLPNELGNLSNLQILDFSFNQLTSLPNKLGNLSNLQYLFLNSNQLTSLPNELGNLSNLQYLFLNSNQLTSLPNEFGNLSNLQELFLNSNQLTSLPSQFSKLSNLQYLFLDNNKLTKLPNEIGYLTNLGTLSVSGNKNLKSPTPEVVSQGTRAILDYFQDINNGCKKWVSKLLIVGQGGVGKTSMLKNLMGNTFNLDESTTHGMQIGTLQLPHATLPDINMELAAWDFGGQEIYHATHQFFLTNRSLFVLVWNARHDFEQGKLYYWLDTIQARAPQSPIIVVATFIDERDAVLPTDDLQRRYPSIKAYCEISNKDRTGIELLRNTIIKEASKLPLMGELWPASWLQASEKIKEKAKSLHYISPSELWEITKNQNLRDSSAKVLIQWLHELGELLFFNNDEDLNDLVVLSPHWVNQQISKSLESKDVIQKEGIFTKAHMNDLWSDINPSTREHLLKLMEKFDLSYRIFERKDVSLVVERLPQNPPNYYQEWQEIKERESSTEIALKFTIDANMPAGIPTWFIARSHRFTTYTHWRYGVMLADSPEKTHLALVEAFPHDRFFRLTVRGPRPENFFALLKDNLEETLKRYPGLEPKLNRLVPCPGHNGNACGYEFKLTYLNKAIEKKPPKLTIECQESFENVSVTKLLYGIHWIMDNEILMGIDEIKKITQQHADKLDETNSQFKNMQEHIKNMQEYMQREFINLYWREQRLEESHCPNIFILRSLASEGFFKEAWEKVSGTKIELHLYCQYPGEWHPTKEGGRYVIDNPAAWLRACAPYIKHLVNVLKYAASFLAPGLAHLDPKQYEKIFKNDVRLMEALVGKLPDIQEDSPNPLSPIVAGEINPIENRHWEFLTENRVEGAPLRAIRAILEKLDTNKHWGGLRKKLTPENHYLWLCQHHYDEYEKWKTRARHPYYA